MKNTKIKNVSYRLEIKKDSVLRYFFKRLQNNKNKKTARKLSKSKHSYQWKGGRQTRKKHSLSSNVYSHS